MAKHTKKQAKISKTKKPLITHPKLIVFLLILLAIPAAIFAYNRYKDWDNAQMIRGLANDFPSLVQKVESATGLELEERIDCSITQEKFGSGVRTCELLVGSREETSSLEAGYSILTNAEKFPHHSDYVNGEGFNAKYRNKQSCQFRTQDTIYISCITAVREANIELAREVFLNE